MSIQHTPVAEVSEFEMVRGTRQALSLVAAKWSVEVVYLLATGTRRYSEVLYEVGEISKKTLTQTLRSLEAGGLILRRAYAEVPTRVEYSLTPLGWSLTGPLMELYEWSAENLGDRAAEQRPRFTVVRGEIAATAAPPSDPGRPPAPGSGPGPSRP
jgi:DNA-binding HxlR family transcriptional regulator